MAHAIPAIGSLDPDFNSGGMIPGTATIPATDFGNVRAMALQPDGKIVVAGSLSNDFALARYNSDGTLDAAFNGTGIVTTDFGTYFDWATGVVVQPDGKLVVAGYGYSGTDNDIAVARYNSDGSLDSSFGKSGRLFTDFGSTSDHAGDLALQSDGKLVVSGYRDLGGGNFDYILARYNSDGNLDSSFGNGGLVTTALGSNNDWQTFLTLQPDGKIILASAYSSSGSDFIVARYTANGDLDTTFNPTGSLSAGVVTTDFGSGFEAATAVLVQPDGKIVAAGFSRDSNTSIALVRYNADGSLDSGFGTGGKTLYNPGGTGDTPIYTAVLQPNGSIVVAGNHYTSTVNDAILVRFNPDGTPESVADSPFGTANDTAYALAVQPDGKLVAAGSVDGDMYLARYISSDAPWDLTPDKFSFTDKSDVPRGSQQTSNMITIAGLGSDVTVPVMVANGEYARNGSTTYTSHPGWVKNGDTLNVRQTASSSGKTTTDTILAVGGIEPDDNLAMILGPAIVDAFSTTTNSGKGSGMIDTLSLAILIASGWLVRRRWH